MTADARMFRQLVRWGLTLPDLPGAACTQRPDLPWVPDEAAGRPTKRLMAVMRGVCAGCPELAACREYALGEPRAAGMWAGMTASERELRRAGR